MIGPSRTSRTLRAGAVLIASGAIFSACSGGSSTPVAPIRGGGGSQSATPTFTPTPRPSGSVSAATPTPTPTATATTGSTAACSTTNFATAQIGTGGGTVQLTASNGGVVTFTIPGLSAAATVKFSETPQSGLPAPLYRSRSSRNAAVKSPMFTQGAGNTYAYAFCADFGGATPTGAVNITATNLISSSVGGAGTALVLAELASSTWTDVGTGQVGASGAYAENAPTATLPGLATAGDYLIYKPAQGSSTAIANFGLAIIADDGSGTQANGFQIIHFEDANGNALPSPTQTFVPIQAGDLDGQALTPDASRGTTVDGSNVVYFLSGFNTGNITVSPNTVDISQFGGDGDSIVSLPDGNEVVANGNGNSIAIIGGILAGTPAIADSIPLDATAGSDRDGMVMSNDGRVLLARGSSGLTVWSVASASPHAGTFPTGVTPPPSAPNVTHTYTQTAEYISPEGSEVAPATAPPASQMVPVPSGEDGRDGLAISPADSSRAVIIGIDGNSNPVAQLITGLPSTPTLQSIKMRIPFNANVHRRPPSKEQSRRRQAALQLGATESAPYAVAITPDGQFAYVGTTAGIALLSGVNTGTLTQVGTPYNPTFGPTGAGCTLGTSFGTLAVSLDGKYVIATASCTNATVTTPGEGILVVIPIGANGALGTPASYLAGSVTPFNDQIIQH